MTDVGYTGAPRRQGRAALIVSLLLVGLTLGAVTMLWAIRAYPAWFMTAPAAHAGQPAAATQPADPGTLASRGTQLAAQLATLENRTASITNDTRAAAGNAGRAEAIMIAFAARRALERGVGLGYLEPQLRARFWEVAPAETNTVIAAARRPVTLEDLRAGLEAAGPALLARDSNWWSGIGSELRNLIVVHPAGVVSPRPADRLQRALRLIDRGNVEAALAEVRRLPGAASAENWTQAAARYVATARALDTLETAAIVGAPATVRPAEPPAAVSSTPTDAPQG